VGKFGTLVGQFFHTDGACTPSVKRFKMPCEVSRLHYNSQTYNLCMKVYMNHVGEAVNVLLR